MKKSKLFLGLSSVVALTAVATGCGHQGNETSDTKTADKPSDNTKSDVKTSDQTTTVKKAADSQSKPTTTQTTQKGNVKTTVTKTGGTTPSAKVNVDKTAKSSTPLKSSPKTVNVVASQPTYPSTTVTQPSQYTNTSTGSGSSSSPSQSTSTTTTKTVNSTESLGYSVIDQNDSSLDKGKTEIAQYGQKGTKTITYEETFTDGKLTSKQEVSSKVTKEPVNEIVKVGTKVATSTSTYLSASQASSILSGAGVFSVSGATYHMDDQFGSMVETKVGSNHVTSVFFDGTTYYSIKNSSEQDCIDALGPVQGPKEYQAGLQEMAKIESAIRASANAVYGSGTSAANNLYYQILNGGKSSSGYYRTF